MEKVTVCSFFSRLCYLPTFLPIKPACLGVYDTCSGMIIPREILLRLCLVNNHIRLLSTLSEPWALY